MEIIKAYSTTLYRRFADIQQWVDARGRYARRMCIAHCTQGTEQKQRSVVLCGGCCATHHICIYNILLSLSLSLSNSKGIAGILGRVNRGLCLLFLVCSMVRESGVALSSSAMLSSGVVQNNGVVIVRNGGCVL